VSVVAAATPAFADGGLAEAPFIVASEYERMTRGWLERSGLRATVVRSYGATEVFPPEDADCIVDNMATGETLRANGLVIVDELMRSSTRLYANPHALERSAKRERIERLVLLLRSVLDARQRVMLEVNVPAERLSAVIAVLPSMREPTMSPLHGDQGFAVKAAVPRTDLPRVIPEIKARGGTDIIVTALAQIVP
jgi:ATP phosphoribosyltransferase-like protein